MNFKLPDSRILTLPTVHFGVMGVHHGGKSKLCASMEKPLLVLAADPFSKMQAYFDEGVVDDEVYVGQFQQPVRIVRSVTTGKAIVQVECFLDSKPTIPWGYQALLSRLDQVADEVRAGLWKSVALDSWSQVEFIAKLRRTTGPFSSGVDSIMAAVKDDCEQLIKARIATLLCNVGVTMHINTKLIDAGGGTMLYEPIATGTLKSGIGSVLGEMYRAVATPDINAPGGVKYSLQTIPDGRFDCGTNIGAPNGCPNNFQALFTNWIAKRAAQPVPPAAVQPAQTETPAAPQEENKS